MTNVSDVKITLYKVITDTDTDTCIVACGFFSNIRELKNHDEVHDDDVC